MILRSRKGRRCTVRRLSFRKRFYLSLEELQEDLDAWLETYNTGPGLTMAIDVGPDPLRVF